MNLRKMFIRSLHDAYSHASLAPFLINMFPSYDIKDVECAREISRLQNNTFSDINRVIKRGEIFKGYFERLEVIYQERSKYPYILFLKDNLADYNKSRWMVDNFDKGFKHIKFIDAFIEYFTLSNNSLWYVDKGRMHILYDYDGFFVLIEDEDDLSLFLLRFGEHEHKKVSWS